MRSQGCWTCRLRRKKCDEAKPFCEACTSRKIDCHGYGVRPEWMTGEDKEQAERARIQDGVRLNQRQLRREEKLQRAREAKQQGKPGSRQRGYSFGQSLQYGQTALPPIRSLISSSSTSSPESPFSTITATSNEGSSLYGRFGSRREAELLMHYLDHVFVLQFRFHTPSVQAGGRGWLLWLLTETKPLYYAALSLSALHQHAVLGRVAGDDSLSELHEHHNRTLKELQIILQSTGNGDVDGRGIRKQLQVLACGVALISFELFRGGTSEWQLHLRAVTSVIIDTIPTRQNLTPDSLEDKALVFLTGVVIWFDILACASTGMAPNLMNHYDSILPRVDLPNVMGCQTWAMLAIANIAALREWKVEEETKGTLSIWDLVERGRVIHEHLERQIADLTNHRRQQDCSSPVGNLQFSHAEILPTGSPQTTLVESMTLAYANAAKVYLHTVISGAKNSIPEIRSSVGGTLLALQNARAIADHTVIRASVWPVCIAGCMANDTTAPSNLGDDADMKHCNGGDSDDCVAQFRELLQDMGPKGLEFGNCSTVLAVMETCWGKRASESNASLDTASVYGTNRLWDWSRAMEAIGVNVLLV